MVSVIKMPKHQLGKLKALTVNLFSRVEILLVRLFDGSLPSCSVQVVALLLVALHFTNPNVAEAYILTMLL